MTPGTRIRRRAAGPVGRRRLVGAVALVALAGGLSAACGAGDDEVIRVYTGRHYDLEAAFVEFSEQTGIAIEFLEGSDPELRERIVAEGEDTEADVFMTVDVANLAIAAEEGMFREIDSPALDEAVPANLRDPRGGWYALSLRARTIVHSTERLDADEVPTTYAELAEPQWQGRVCLRNSSSTYTQSLVAALIAREGEGRAREIVEGWAANAEILPNDVLILESVAEGLCDVGITNHYYLARLLEEDPDFPVGLVWAEQDAGGTHVNVSGAGVTRHADDPELAQQLLEWLATDGQSLFVDGNHEYPVNPDVEPDELITTEFGATFVADEVDAGEVGGLNADAVRLLDEAGYE